MKHTSRILSVMITLLLLAPAVCGAANLNYSQREMADILKIAKEIHVIQPFLDDSKYMEYAVGIYRASKHYDIEPEILIAITQRETAFREDLPEGKAGELGICQIRKMWISQPRFRAEFKRAKIRDLFRPSKSFLYAAWILRQLKREARSSSIPYWSYYNSVRFENRFKYFLGVNKYLVALRRGEPTWVETSVSHPRESETARMLAATRRSSTPLPSSRWLTPAYRAYQSAKPKRRFASNGGWIPAALKKLQEQDSQSYEQNRTARQRVSPAILRAAAELDVKGLFSSNSASLAD